MWKQMRYKVLIQSFCPPSWCVSSSKGKDWGEFEKVQAAMDDWKSSLKTVALVGTSFGHSSKVTRQISWHQIPQHSIRGQAESRSHGGGSAQHPAGSHDVLPDDQWCFGKSYKENTWFSFQLLCDAMSDVHLGILGCLIFNCVSVNMHVLSIVKHQQFHRQHIHQYQQWVQNLVLFYITSI